MHVREVDENNMWGEIYQQASDIVARFLDKGIFLLSLIGSVFLSAIGFPKQIIVFIVALTIIDILTKHLSIVIVNYSSLSFSNYFKAWKDKVLTSRQLKNGIAVKTILYSSILYIANQLGIIDGILFGKQISGILYSSIVFVEVSSVLENLIAMGGTGLIPLLDYVKHKQKQIFGGKRDKENNN